MVSMEMQPYKHTQTAASMIGVFALSTIGTFAALYFARLSVLAAVLAALLFALLGFTFSALTVQVDEDGVAVWFGLGGGCGWPKRRLPWDEIRSAERVRNSCIEGYGIRAVRNGWMFNVAGLDAVELGLRSGRVFRVGTDDPDALLAACKARMPAHYQRHESENL